MYDESLEIVMFVSTYLIIYFIENVNDVYVMDLHTLHNFPLYIYYVKLFYKITINFIIIWKI